MDEGGNFGGGQKFGGGKKKRKKMPFFPSETSHAAKKMLDINVGI